jgi:hydroxymethylpyrimidine/phosphomethylpyrimidine kinase
VDSRRRGRDGPGAIYDSDPVEASQIGSGDEGRAGAPITVVVVGGVDPSGGAGLVRDVLTAAALGARAIAIGTAWTRQGGGVHAVEPRDPAALADALRHELSRRQNVAAVKIGMVPDADAAAAIVAGLGAYAGPVVVDPVLASSRGGALTRATAAELLPLLRRATLATPNAVEAAHLTGRPVTDVESAAAAGGALIAAGVPAVLVKGGHLGGAALVTDTLLVGTSVRRFTRARLPGDVRGTGCALATALAVQLGRGASLDAAVEAATSWLARALAAAVDVAVEGDGDLGVERHLP